jgi:AraC-like DNA-binding protein
LAQFSRRAGVPPATTLSFLRDAQIPVSFENLTIVNASPAAKRTMWYLYSVGTVWRDEIEHHQGADKAGLHLFWVRSGKGLLETPSGQFNLETGPQCWLVDLRRQRIYRPIEGTRLVTDSFRFGGPLQDAWLALLGGAGEVAMNSPLMVQLNKIHRALIRVKSANSSSDEWRIHLLVTQAWGNLLEARGHFSQSIHCPPVPVQRVIDAVRARPLHDWQARELSSVAGVSYSGLRSAFKHSRDETLHDFLQQVRLDQAYILLADTKLSIKEVSVRLNFNDATYFSHWFQRLHGNTPGGYRRSIRG